jgi:hypothetical protein
MCTVQATACTAYLPASTACTVHILQSSRSYLSRYEPHYLKIGSLQHDCHLPGGCAVHLQTVFPSIRAAALVLQPLHVHACCA